MSAAARRVVILGSTGSIGRQALDVISHLPDRLEVVGLAAGSDADALKAQAAAAGVNRTALGEEAAIELARDPDADVVLNAIVGAAGLRASLAALEAGTTLALANKESLVAGGELCAAAAARGGARIVPVDSEHAALAQCLEGRADADVRRLIVTASGGPFRSRRDLAGVTTAEALAHPTWSMGPKITVDSATLMNKGLEVLEAHHLFGFSYDQIDVVVHPQSIVHAIIELADGSLLMHAAAADMRIPIRWALLDENGGGETFERLDLVAAGSLEFEALDHERFPAVNIAYEAGRTGGSAPAVLNAANEVAVHAFLDERLAFVEITRVVEEVVGSHDPTDVDGLGTVLEADAWARSAAARAIEERALAGTGRRP